MTEWSSPRRIPLGHARGLSHIDGQPNPEHVQANLFTLAQIGGIYDLLALEVERQHREILAAWRLVSGAPSTLDYLEERDRMRSTPSKPEKRDPHA